MTASLQDDARRPAGRSSPAPAFDDARIDKALEGFFAIMALWRADTGQMRRILGAPPERTFYASP